SLQPLLCLFGVPHLNPLIRVLCWLHIILLGGHITPLRRHIAPLWLLWFLVPFFCQTAWIQRHASLSLLRHCDCSCGVTVACFFGCGCGDVSKRTSGRYSRSLLHHVVCGCGVTVSLPQLLGVGMSFPTPNVKG